MIGKADNEKQEFMTGDRPVVRARERFMLAYVNRSMGQSGQLWPGMIEKDPRTLELEVRPQLNPETHAAICLDDVAVTIYDYHLTVV